MVGVGLRIVLSCHGCLRMRRRIAGNEVDEEGEKVKNGKLYR